MRIVDQATKRPYRCSVVPFIGNSNARCGFFDTGVDVGPGEGDRVYISVAEAGVMIAREIGWVPPSAVTQRDEEIASLKARVEQLEAENEEQGRLLDSIEYIGRGPMKPYKKSGRKPKEKSEVTA